MLQKQLFENVLMIHDVMEARTEFWEMYREEQGQWLLNFFFFSRKIKNGRSHLQYIVNKYKEVCQKAWIFGHGLSYGR